jgi:Predicted metal-binding integral membrane protein (DUF2182)
VGQFGTKRPLCGDQLVELTEAVSSRSSRAKSNFEMANSLHDTIRTQASSGLIVWFPALAGWLLLYWEATNMDSPAAQLTMPMSDWSAANWLAVFIMWAVMMAAMMLPAAAPMVSVFASLNKSRGQTSRTVAFVAGYLALWTAFAAAATAAQWALQTSGLLSPMIVSMSPVLSGALLAIAGVFQFTPLKQACLRACRSPLGFLLTDWRDGLWGAARMGVRPRPLLSRLLLGADGLAVCRRRHEFALDRRAHPSRRDGEDRASWRRRWASS